LAITTSSAEIEWVLVSSLIASVAEEGIVLSILTVMILLPVPVGRVDREVVDSLERFRTPAITVVFGLWMSDERSPLPRPKVWIVRRGMLFCWVLLRITSVCTSNEIYFGRSHYELVLDGKDGFEV